MKKIKWGFDLTHFGDGIKGAEIFRDILYAVNLPTKAKRRKNYKGMTEPLNTRPFVFKRRGLRLVMGNNPLTGKYSFEGRREDELGYASYIGISGDEMDVKKIAKLIRINAEFIKEETPNESGFIN